MIIQSVFATDENGGIGIDNKLPWPFNRHDMSHFIKTTENSILVMGTNTWCSLPTKLKGRVHVVLSSKSLVELEHKGEFPDHVIDYNDSLDHIESELLHYTELYQIETVSIIGGAKVYNQLNPLVDTIIHTTISGTYKVDTKLDVKALTESFNIIYLDKALEKGDIKISKYKRR